MMVSELAAVRTHPEGRGQWDLNQNIDFVLLRQKGGKIHHNRGQTRQRSTNHNAMAEGGEMAAAFIP